MIETRRLEIGIDDAGRRADRILRIILSSYPLSFIHRTIRKGNILLNGRKFRPNALVQEGDILEIDSSLGIDNRRHLSNPPSSPLDPTLILVENDTFLVLNKPRGILVHNGRDSLEAMVRGYLAKSDTGSISFTPGPLHRLDRNTSGIIVFSKALTAARSFSEAMRSRKFVKIYLALLEGELLHQALWDDALVREGLTRKTNVLQDIHSTQESSSKAKQAVTRVFPILSNKKITFALFTISTGRTHQLRAQASHQGYPLCGDMKYGGSPFLETETPQYLLHAWKLRTNNEPLPGFPSEIEAPLPNYFSQIVAKTFLLDKKEVYSTLANFRI
jgi:23S rRNA pseudouridine955/2504/2580 synthase